MFLPVTSLYYKQQAVDSLLFVLLRILLLFHFGAVILLSASFSFLSFSTRALFVLSLTVEVTKLYRDHPVSTDDSSPISLAMLKRVFNVFIIYFYTLILNNV
jgi:hypothetical protein